MVAFWLFAHRSTYSASTSSRIWNASSVPFPLNMISGRSSLSAGIFPTIIIWSLLSPQNSWPTNFRVIGRSGLYTENSEQGLEVAGLT